MGFGRMGARGGFGSMGIPLGGVGPYGPPPPGAPANAKPLIGADGAPLLGADGAQLWGS
jgi:hypothetical protein